MFKLVIQDDEGKTTVVPLIRDEITIGRKEGNTIRLTERNVSRRHARILRNNGEVQIEDLGSYNGIRVNNARIAERVSLRISDQVQIGDYKLYLKAEGVEQVDDARTMPIERIDSATATEVMASVSPSATTSPIPVQAAGTGQNQAIRSGVAVADTDPAGRPVATAAQVAAMSAPAGYGKLCVVSNNFAGKEFDLTRPQMIIGRTDENDLVINHRSISRNHAKVTRDPETGRYTISDLQSSNGVRVNGQDYGKVELRRGDVVDLGHVRLRFVEPGEDFIFARDAVIADVPETGSKRTLLVAVVLAIVVLGAVGAFFVFGGKDNGDKKHTGENGSALANGSNNVVVATGSDVAGSNTGSQNVVVEAPIDAAGATVATDDELGRIKVECLGYQTDKSWTDLKNCAHKLDKLDPATAKQLNDKAVAELKNDNLRSKMIDAINEGSLPKARKLLEAIPDDSIYKKQAQADYDSAKAKVIEQLKSDLTALSRRGGKCAEIDKLIDQSRAQGSDVSDAVRSFHCTAVVAPPPADCSGSLGNPKDKKCVAQFCQTHEGDAHCSTGQTAPPAGCDADDLKEKGTQNEAIGQHAAALSQFEQSLHCKGDPGVVKLAFMSACNAGNIPKAKAYWAKLSPDSQNRLLQMCMRNHITKDQLDH